MFAHVIVVMIGIILLAGTVGFALLIVNLIFSVLAIPDAVDELVKIRELLEKREEHSSGFTYKEEG